MSTLRTLRRGLSTVSRLREKRAYDKALAEVETLLKTWPGNPHLYVLKASLVQLQEEPTHDLDEAKQALRQAIELDRGSPAASIELGYFSDNVEDDPRAAVEAYAEGVAAARHLLIEGLIGQAKAYRQLEKKEEFKRCLLEILLLTATGDNADKARMDLFHSPSGYVHAVMFNGMPSPRIVTDFFPGKFKGPYAEQIQELLTELGAD